MCLFMCSRARRPNANKSIYTMVFFYTNSGAQVGTSNCATKKKERKHI